MSAPALLAATPRGRTATDALQEFVRRWALLADVSPETLLSGERLTDREARARDQLCFVLRGLTRAPDELLGFAFNIRAGAIMRCRHRFFDRYKGYPAVETYTSMAVRTIARDEAFLEELLSAVAAEIERREREANRSRSDALFATSRRRSFQERRLQGLQDYFDNGGRQVLADRSRGNQWATKS